MLAGQIKEVTKSTCKLCGQYREISFYSYEICRSCCVCPVCGEQDGLKSFTHICLEVGQQLTGVNCSCGARFHERADMDSKLVERHKSVPHSICKICHGDVLAPANDVAGFANFCERCRVCPTRSCSSIEYDEAAVRCRVCGKRWKDWADFEDYYILAVELGFSTRQV